MASRSAPAHWRYLLLGVAMAGLIAFARWKGWLPQEGPIGSSRKTDPVIHQPGSPSGKTASGSRKTGAWEEWRDCTLVEDRANDGDSFVIRHDGRDHILRLYFADCPEKYRHQYNRERIAEQGRYFGGLTEEETVGIGEAARDFSLGLLRRQPFTVLTRGERVFDSQRCYAFVTTSDGDLAELLVKNGLARIYTKGEPRPGGETAAREKQRLLGLERKAKTSNAGAWARR